MNKIGNFTQLKVFGYVYFESVLGRISFRKNKEFFARSMATLKLILKLQLVVVSHE